MPRATGRVAIAQQVLQEMASEQLAEKPITTEDPEFTPIRIWNAGPGTAQEKLVVPGTTYGVKPTAGFYVLKSQDMVDLAKRAFGPKYWPDDIPADVEPMKCEQCGWTTRSYRAFMAHVNHVHPRPQAAN